MNVSEEIRRLGTAGIKSIQTTFPRSDSFFFSISRFADPLYSFTLIIPLAAGMHTVLATDMMMVSVMAEWSNTLLKWMLMDHRPFWWVQETTVYGKGLRPALRQTPLTCETGPGSPSGHVQGASALMYVVLQHVLRASKGRLSDGRRRYLAMTLWMLYMILMVLVGASRLYTATHFPHQTLLGLVAGVATAWLFVDEGQCTLTERWRSASRPKMLLASVVMIAVSFGAYWLQRLMVRHVMCVSRVRSQPRHNVVIGMVCTLSLMLAFQMAADAVPTSDVRLFYGCQFMLHAVKPFLLFLGIPRIARLAKHKQH
ncbi:glucose-6-phosphatase 2 isoform X3 [Periplaneta americana]|uniref:glucose-6-phosphatase 2 isoform X3 n=1 Tax=Periplaneta americana TaxID=6978 RepID=UPI0037E72134